jgi:hypothetical protein
MRCYVFIVASITVAASAVAQPTPPFFGGGVVAYDPEPAIVSSGVVLDAQATVSDDRKYVTIGTRTTQSNVQAILRFPVVSVAAVGFVGGVTLDAPTAANFSPPPPTADQMERNAKSWIFTRQGMYLVSPLK